MRIAANVTINEEDRPTLERWSRGRSTPARLVLRANIVRNAAAGMANKLIAEKLGTDRQFAAPVVAVVGLYLHPPEHALVRCVE